MSRPISELGTHCLSHEIEDVAALKFAAAGDCHGPRHKEGAARRLRAKAGLAPDDIAAQGSFREVIGWLALRVMYKGPERLPELKELRAGVSEYLNGRLLLHSHRQLSVGT